MASLESTSLGASVSAAPRTVVVGGGWAGIAAAIAAVDQGHQVTLLEASRYWGGRARSIDPPPLGTALQPALDNGQHILIGAYTHTLGLLERVGVDLARSLYVQPLDLRMADGSGLYVPPWAHRLPAPVRLLAAIVTAQGWSARHKWHLLRTTGQWQRQGFVCDPALTVSQLMAPLPQVCQQQLIEPLCLAALNTPTHTASAQVFLQVLHDALLGGGYGPYRASDLLLPTVALSDLLPAKALTWLGAHHAQAHAGQRVQRLAPDTLSQGWQVCTANHTYLADQVVLACTATEAARLAAPYAPAWAACAKALTHQAIATVYVRGRTSRTWSQPMVGLQGTAQFAFHRSRLFGQSPHGQQLWALVASAAQHNAADTQTACLAQAQLQLGLHDIEPVTTVVEKRATFACTALLNRPRTHIATGLWASGDYLENPYPATLEGAVRNSFGLFHQNL